MGDEPAAACEEEIVSMRETTLASVPARERVTAMFFLGLAEGRREGVASVFF